MNKWKNRFLGRMLIFLFQLIYFVRVTVIINVILCCMFCVTCFILLIRINLPFIKCVFPFSFSFSREMKNAVDSLQINFHSFHFRSFFFYFYLRIHFSDRTIFSLPLTHNVIISMNPMEQSLWKPVNTKKNTYVTIIIIVK